jgi:hypothetical protein
MRLDRSVGLEGSWVSVPQKSWSDCFVYSHSSVKKKKFISWLPDVIDLWASDLCVPLYIVSSAIPVLSCYIDLRVHNLFHRCLILKVVT